MKVIATILSTTAAMLIIGAILALPLMLLWNATLPELFGFKTLNFWMALKLSFLASLIFKSNSSSSKSD